MAEIVVIAILICAVVALLVTAFFTDAHSEDERTAAAVARADELIAELEATDELIRRMRLVVAEGVEGHAVAAITIVEVAEQPGDAAANIEATRQRVQAWELEVSRG